MDEHKNRPEIVMMPINSVIPYEKNPRKNAKAVAAVAASIKEFGFRSPIVVAEDMVVINGHTRLKAAKKLGLKEVPVVVAKGLTDKQIREYRIIDNKTSEFAEWDKELLLEEVADLDFDFDADFTFDFADDLKKTREWEHVKKLCDLKQIPQVKHMPSGGLCQTIYKTGGKGKPLDEIKTPEYVPFFTRTALEHLDGLLGGNLSKTGWCIMTTPRRRHAQGFHFATEICRGIAQATGIPFYADAVQCKNKHRVQPEFRLAAQPQEQNVVLYDDITTTGSTIATAAELLRKNGYTVIAVVSIDNR